MGFGRFVKHVLIPGSNTVDMVKNMVDEGSVVEGYKKSIKQEFTEDNPLTSPIYKMGKFDGKKEGYTEASDEYEIKLLQQADEFLKQKKIFEEERDAYEKLLDEYESAIDELESKASRTEEENAYLQELLSRERRLKMFG